MSTAHAYLEAQATRPLDYVLPASRNRPRPAVRASAQRQCSFHCYDMILLEGRPTFTQPARQLQLHRWQADHRYQCLTAACLPM